MGLCLKTNPCLCGVGLLPGEKLIASRRAVLEHNFFFSFMYSTREHFLIVKLPIISKV